MATQEPYNPFPKPPAVAVPTPPPAPKGNGLAIAGMVVGIIGVVAFFIPYLGPILGLLGLIFGVLGIQRSNKVGGAGKGMAIAGVACGAVALIIGIIFTYIVVSAFDDYMGTATRQDAEVQIKRIQRSLRSYWIETQALPPSARTLPGEPGAACQEPGDTFPELPFAVWDEDPGWRALGFQAYGDARYSYRWTKQSESEGIIEAFIDADCDGRISTITSVVTVSNDTVSFDLGLPTRD